MTRKRLFPFLLLFALPIILVAAVSQAQVETPKVKIVDRIAAVLEKAGYPLSQRQLYAIAKIEPGPGARGAMQKILSDDQKKALQNTLKQQRTGLLLRGMAQRLKTAGFPLSDDQIARLKALKPGEGKGALPSILSDDQKKALKESFQKGAGARFILSAMAAQLEKAGCPITESQKAQIKALKPGGKNQEAFMNIHEQVKAILTPEQVAALQKGIGEATPDTGNAEKPTAAGETPRVFNTLKQNYPNPFNPSTTIEYIIAKPGNVRVQIFGTNGQLITTLVESYQDAGVHSATWNAGNLAGGMYICTVTSGTFTQSRKMTLLK